VSIADPTRIETYERRSEVPLLLLAAAFLVAYAWPVLDPTLSSTVRDALLVVSWTVWAAFAIDFAVRLVLTRDRLRYAVRHWYDVLLVALPMLRPLRLLRFIALFRLLHRTAVQSVATRATTYVLGTTVMAMGIGSIAILDAERGAPGATIETFGDALWWSLVTVTTVGYGDFYPVTTMGRLIAAALMVVGIALVGAVTASLAAWFVDSATADREEADEQTEGQAV